MGDVLILKGVNGEMNSVSHENTATMLFVMDGDVSILEGSNVVSIMNMNEFNEMALQFILLNDPDLIDNYKCRGKWVAKNHDSVKKH